MKYFLDCNGIRTGRMAGKPGSGHIEIAVTTEQLDPKGDVYQQMFALGYVRVMKTDAEILVDAPLPLTPAQERFLDAKKAAGKQLKTNDTAFIENRG